MQDSDINEHTKKMTLSSTLTIKQLMQNLKTKENHFALL